MPAQMRSAGSVRLSSQRAGHLFLALSLMVFFALCLYQLDLPGLHYDEAREAGLNAMELVSWQPLTAFRGATLQIGPWRLPLMVQDYIGAANVLLATPFLALGGVSVSALRALPVLIGAATLVLVWRVALKLGDPFAAGSAALLMAVSPTHAFWSRQGIFVTNLTALLFSASLLTGIMWWRKRRARYLYATTCLWGLGLYAKLLFIWALVAMLVLGVILMVRERRSLMKQHRGHSSQPSLGLSPMMVTIALAAFSVPLFPLLLFNLRTGGTWSSITGNLASSYYGVDNSAYFQNLATRMGQIVSLLRGDQFWYLGEAHANPQAPWMALLLLLLAAGCSLGRRANWAWAIPTLLLLLAVTQSAFTVSDLFVTHFALLAPLVPLSGGLAFGHVFRSAAQVRNSDKGLSGFAARRLGAAVAILALACWVGGDFRTTLRYHGALSESGGLATHSDGIYALADYLDASGFATALALDWGIDAQVRFLTAGRVTPIEVFGYTSLNEPDPGYRGRMAPFLADPGAVYLAHAPEQVVFGGRTETLIEMAEQLGLQVEAIHAVTERSGRPLFVVYRVMDATPDF